MQTSTSILEKFERWLTCLGRISGVGTPLLPMYRARAGKGLRRHA